MRLPTLIAAASLLAGTTAFAQSDPSSDFAPPPLPGDPGVWEPYQPTVGADSGSAGGTEVTSSVFDTTSAPGARINRVTAGVLSPLTGTFSAEYERALTDRASVFAGPRIALIGITSIGLSAGARYFPLAKDTAPAGFWVGPELWLEYGDQSGTLNGVSYANQENTAFALAMAGYTVVRDNGFTFSFGGGIGGGYYARQGTGVQNVTFSPTGLTSPTAAVGSVNELSLKPSLGLQFNMGYAF